MIRVLPGLGQKGVTQRMQARIRVRLDLFAQLRHLLFEHPGPHTRVFRKELFQETLRCQSLAPRPGSVQGIA